jgi:hypothetical protein
MSLQNWTDRNLGINPASVNQKPRARLRSYELENPFKNSMYPDRISGRGTCPTVSRVKPSMRD